MTNEQLAIVIRGYVDALQDALDEARALLPPELAEQRRSFLGAYEVQPALEPFDSVLDRMKGDVPRLTSDAVVADGISR